MKYDLVKKEIWRNHFTGKTLNAAIQKAENYKRSTYFLHDLSICLSELGYNPQDCGAYYYVRTWIERAK